MRQKGFTIIELLIATMVFSVLLLLCMSGIVYVGRLYYKGVTSQAVQEVSRSSLDQIRADYELNSGTFKVLPSNGANDGFCIGQNLYSYELGRRITTNDGHALVVRTAPECLENSVIPDDVSGSNPAWREMLGVGMQLQTLDIVEDNDHVGASISINVVLGEADLFDPDTGLCNTAPGSQYCANSSLSTYATRRIGGGY